ncbi:hypothetical protein MKZ38_008549 [Zalerion maritima]|uniref:Uncharacterized protein n=1 Tax=Zalerion maritima TaxID=339359 RepID=A0AAD5RV97_9PEZI|nr:hypothetical protein MKZ38_008549 [Zalerion maritima]
MPIGQRKKLFKETPASDPRTGLFQADPAKRPAPYKPTPDPPKSNTSISSTRDLNYFHSLVSGEYPLDSPFSSPPPYATNAPPSAQPQLQHRQQQQQQQQNQQLPGATLVLHLFRGTITHIHPISERLTLGPGQGSPYYHCRGVPSTTSPFEHNTLLLSRRHPLNLVGNEICAVEIRPNVVMHGSGMRDVGTIRRTTQGTGLKVAEEYSMTWMNKTGSPLDGCWNVWRNGNAVCHIFEENGYQGLDSDPPKGIIRIKPPNEVNSNTNKAPQIFQDPRAIPVDLAYLDFSSCQEPLFVSEDPRAHLIMDVVVSALFMMLTVSTRKANALYAFKEQFYQATGVDLGL